MNQVLSLKDFDPIFDFPSGDYDGLYCRSCGRCTDFSPWSLSSAGHQRVPVLTVKSNWFHLPQFLFPERVTRKRLRHPVLLIVQTVSLHALDCLLVSLTWPDQTGRVVVRLAELAVCLRCAA